MMKAGKRTMIIGGSVLAVLVLVLLWLFMFGGSEVLANLATTQAITTTDTGTSGGGAGSTSQDPPPSVDESCDDHDISQENRDHFGDAVIETVRGACASVGGWWTETRSEMSCRWAPDPTLDCFTQQVSVSAEFCANTMLAHFLCNPNIAYLGCYCNEADEPEDCDDFCWDEGYEQGYFDLGAQCAEGEAHIGDCCCSSDTSELCENTYPDCEGTCDDDLWCIEVNIEPTGYCMCIPDYPNDDCDSYCFNNVPDTTGGYKVHSSADCDAEEIYSDGCCCYLEDNGNGDLPEYPDDEECFVWCVDTQGYDRGATTYQGDCYSGEIQYDRCCCWDLGEVDEFGTTQSCIDECAASHDWDFTAIVPYAGDDSVCIDYANLYCQMIGYRAAGAGYGPATECCCFDCSYFVDDEV